jgi:hypothetical protein
MTRCSSVDGKFFIRENAAENASVAMSRRKPASEVNVTLPLEPRMWAWLRREERINAAEETTALV